MRKFFLLLGLLLTMQWASAQCLQGDCINGFGVLKCDCGYTFEGQFKDGLKLHGTLTKADLVYTGQFKNDVAHGVGTIRYADGSWYEGEFQFSQPHGYGKFQYASGTWYIGQFENGQFNGIGMLHITHADSTVQDFELGEFKNDELNGMAMASYPNTNCFFGQHANGQKTGYGIFVMPASQDAEIGIFKPNKNIKNVAMLNYPNAGEIQANAFVYKGESYTSFGNFDTNPLLITHTSQGKKVVYGYWASTQTFFKSTPNSNLGIAINAKGQIFEAEVNLESNAIVLKKMIQSWEPELD